jgi:arginase
MRHSPASVPMKLHILAIPYDTALRNFRMGGGPDRLLRAGLPGSLEAAGHLVEVEHVSPGDNSIPAEISSSFELNRALASRVRAAVDAGAVPIVLAGNCISAVGTLAGLSPTCCAVLWFDSHGDFNTPETTIGGFLDGMALSTVTGRCWRQLAATVQGHRPVSETDVVLLGTRDLDPLEEDLLASSDVTVLSPMQVRSDLTEIVRELSSRVKDVYVHLDLDVLDPAEGQANALAAPDGLSLEDVRAALETIRAEFRIRAIALTAYDPAFDPDGHVVRAAITLLHSAVSDPESVPGAT